MPLSACSTALTAVDQNLLPAGHSVENPPADVAAVDRWDRQMDGHLTITKLKTADTKITFEYTRK